MKKITLKLLMITILMISFACTKDGLEEIQENTMQSELSDVLSRGKPIKVTKKRNIVLTPTAINNNEIGRIAETPVEFTGKLPIDDGTLIDTNNDGAYDTGFVDWNNDTIEDKITITNDPSNFGPVITVFLSGIEEHVINYSLESRWAAIQLKVGILGFEDINGNGFKDIILQGGNPYLYDGNSLDQELAKEEYSPYNVAYNVSDQYPLSTSEIVESLVVTSVDRRPNNLVWDLSEYGHECARFQVSFYNKTIGDFRQTKVYGEFGFFYNKKFISGDTYELRFSENLLVNFVYK